MERSKESHCVCEDSYERLANAIILQAVEEYRGAMKIRKNNPQNRDAENEILRIERFFRSDWFMALTTIDGEYLIRILRSEIEND